MAPDSRTAILACEVFRDELELLAPEGTRLIYLRQSLHRTPQIMAGEIQTELDQLEPGSVDRVILAYGLCSNGIVGVRATRGKRVRAEPVAALYEQGRVHHVGAFAELEKQMCRFVAAKSGGIKSPDRLDALVWAITELASGAPSAPNIRLL